MSKKEGRILIVDDNKDLLIALRIILSRHFEQIEILSNPNLLLAEMDKHAYDLVLLDMNFKAGKASGNEGLFWMKKVLEKDPDMAVVFITAYGDVELAVNSMKEGASDFILKSWEEQKIVSTVLSAYRLRKSRQEVAMLKMKRDHLKSELDDQFRPCKCLSGPMKELDKIVSKVAVTDASILILGENGTGKEILAREIHRRSAQKDDVFVKVDLGAIPETLFESELFGHKKGSYTDAHKDREGRFVIASGGTLFLDEIGNLPLSLQAKLLSAIQNREVYPLGSSTAIKTDVRIIAATNMPLEEMISRKEFREDLFFRINAIQLEIPPLRARKDDIPVLAEYFREKYGRQYGRSRTRLSKAAEESLLKHPWPGNIRELEHAMEKGIILSGDGDIRPEHLFPQGTKTRASAPASLKLEEQEKFLVEKAIAEHAGNITSAARALGINRSTLYQKINKYGL